MRVNLDSDPAGDAWPAAAPIPLCQGIDVDRFSILHLDLLFANTKGIS
jgi:hypothetical protein